MKRSIFLELFFPVLYFIFSSRPPIPTRDEKEILEFWVHIASHVWRLKKPVWCPNNPSTTGRRSKHRLEYTVLRCRAIFRWFWFCLGVVFDSYSTKVKSLISNIILNCRPVKMLLFSRNTHIYFVKISTFRRLGVNGAGDTPQWRLRLRQNTRLYGSATLLYTKRRYIQINYAKYRLDLLPNAFAYIKSLT